MFNDEPQVNPKKLFVGNLPWSTTEDDLREIFSQFGELAEENGVRLITDRFSGRSKGIAFVEYTGENAEEAAQAALEATNGTELDGRTINVSIARPPKPREERGFGGGDRGRGGFGGGNRGGFGGGDRGRGGFGGGRDRNRGGNRGGYNRDDRQAA